MKPKKHVARKQLQMLNITDCQRVWLLCQCTVSNALESQHIYSDNKVSFVELSTINIQSMIIIFQSFYVCPFSSVLFVLLLIQSIK